MPADVRVYNRRPLQVEAVQLTTDADWEAIAQWCGGKIQYTGSGLRHGVALGSNPCYAATPGDWLVRDNGRFYKVPESGFMDFEPAPDLELPLCPRCCARVEVIGTACEDATGECGSCGWKYDSAFRWEARR